MSFSKQDIDGIISKVRSKSVLTFPISIQTLTKAHVYGPVVSGLESIHKAFRKDVGFKNIQSSSERHKGNPTLRPTYVYDGDSVEFVSDGYSAMLLDSAEFLVNKTPLGRNRSRPKPRPWTSPGSDLNRPNLNNLVNFKNISPIQIIGSHDGVNFSALVFSSVNPVLNGGKIYVDTSLLMPIVAEPLSRDESIRFESDGLPLSPVFVFTGTHRSTLIGIAMPIRVD